MTFPPPSGPRAGWYPDPYGQPWVRYHDGRAWTGHVAHHRSPPPSPAPVVDHPTLPFPVVIGAVVILAASLIGSRPLLDRSIEGDWPVPLLMLLAVLVGYGPSVVWLAYVSRRWGSGRPFADLGVRFRWVDLGWGPLVWVGTIVAMGLALQVVEALGVPYRGNLDLHLTGPGVAAWLVADVNRTALVSLVASTVICAPVVEEAIFRGAVMRGLLSKMPATPAVIIQGVLFGSAHFNPDFGRESIGLIVVLSVAGTGFGLAAYLLRRIGPTIIAHAILNGVAITVALVTDS